MLKQIITVIDFITNIPSMTYIITMTQQLLKVVSLQSKWEELFFKPVGDGFQQWVFSTMSSVSDLFFDRWEGLKTFFIWVLDLAKEALTKGHLPFHKGKYIDLSFG